MGMQDCFFGATSKQLLHCLDVNLDHITDTVKLHLKTNNIFNDTSASNIESFVTSIKDMAQIWVTRVFI